MVHDGIGGDGSQSSGLPSTVVDWVLVLFVLSLLPILPLAFQAKLRETLLARVRHASYINGQWSLLATMLIARVRTRVIAHLAPWVLRQPRIRTKGCQDATTLVAFKIAYSKITQCKDHTSRSSHLLRITLKGRDLMENTSQGYHTGTRV